MTVNRWLRLIAGTFVLASLALGYWVSPYFFLFTAFVGLNLFQSGITNSCPMMALLRALGVPEASGDGRSAGHGISSPSH
jgi:hypothetical protein